MIEVGFVIIIGIGIFHVLQSWGLARYIRGREFEIEQKLEELLMAVQENER